MTWLIALAIYQFFGFLVIMRFSLRYSPPNNAANWLSCIICYALWPILLIFDIIDPFTP